MIDSYYRSFYQRHVVAPLLKIPLAKRLHPNACSCIAVLLGIAIYPLALYQHPKWAVLFLMLSGFFDTMDGSLARAFNKRSNMGAVLDITFDRLVEWSILLGLFSIDPQNRALFTLSMGGAILCCVTAFLVIGIFTENSSQKSFHYNSGLIERSEAFLFFSTMFLFPKLFPFLAVLFTALVSLTAILHIRHFYKHYSML